MRKWLALIASVGFLSVAAAAQTPDPKLAANGKKVFDATKCSMCHGVEGKGNRKLALDGVSKKLSSAEIRQWITNPVEMTAKLDHKPPVPMKKFDLKDADVDALVAYVMSLK